MTANRWTFIAAGDVCVRGRVPSAPMLSERLHSVISDGDLAFCNLEGAIANGDRRIDKVGSYLALDPDVCDRLAETGFDGVALANNHVMDFGWPALERALHACDASGLAHTGAGKSHTAALAPVMAHVNGVRCAVMAVAEHEFGIASADEPGAAWSSHPDTIEAIETAAAGVDVLIVFSHGGVEEIVLPPVERQAQLHAFIDAGAKVVIGTHPHIIQGWERYKDGVIFYSLGDFVFDYRDVAERPSGLGALTRIEFNGSAIVDVALLPTRFTEGGATDLVDNAESADILAGVAELNRIVGDPALFDSAWGDVAAQLMTERYGPWLAYSRRFRARTRLRPAARKRTQLLMLNLERCESHRWTIARGLSLQRAGKRSALLYPESARLRDVTAMLMGL